MNSREKQSLLDDVFLQAGGAPFRPEYKLSTLMGALPFRVLCERFSLARQVFFLWRGAGEPLFFKLR
jgi:hypothetical protein